MLITPSEGPSLRLVSGSGFLRLPACVYCVVHVAIHTFFAIMAIQLQLSPPLRSGKLWIMVGSPPQPVNWWVPPYITSSPLNIGWCIHAVELSGDPSTLGITWTFTRNLHGGGISVFPHQILWYALPLLAFYGMCTTSVRNQSPLLVGFQAQNHLGSRYSSPRRALSTYPWPVRPPRSQFSGGY